MDKWDKYTEEMAKIQRNTDIVTVILLVITVVGALVMVIVGLLS